MSLRTRSRRMVRVERPPEEVLHQLLERAAQADPPLFCKHRALHLWVFMPEAVRHAWSPALDIHLRPDDDGVRVVSRLGPQPNLWTAYVFAYSAFGVLVLFGGCWGMAQWAMGDPPVCLWGSLAAMVGAAVLWFSGKLGATLTRPQWDQLAAVLDDLPGSVPEPLEVG